MAGPYEEALDGDLGEGGRVEVQHGGVGVLGDFAEDAVARLLPRVDAAVVARLRRRMLVAAAHRHLSHAPITLAGSVEASSH